MIDGLPISFLCKISFLILVVLVLDDVMRRRWVLLTAAMWNAVLLALLVSPLTLLLPSFVIPVPTQSLVVGSPQSEMPAEYLRHSGQDQFSIPTGDAPRANPADSGFVWTVVDVLLPANSPVSEGSLFGAFAWIYNIGVAISLGRLIGSWRAVNALRSRAIPVTSRGWLERRDHWLKKLGLGSVQLLASDEVDVPIALGVFKPTVLIPARMSSEASTRVLDSILIHELAHISRADCAWQIVQRVVEAALWFHPFIWIARRRIAFIRERACDDFAVYSVGDVNAYAETLLDVAGTLTQRVSLVLGLAVMRSSKLTSRLAALYRGASNHRCKVSAITRMLLIGGAITCAALIATVAVQRLPVLGGAVQSEAVDCRLRVVDEHDKPVAHFEALTYSADKPNTVWWPGKAGSVTLHKTTSAEAKRIEVLVRAEGFASTISRFTGDQCDQLRRGEAKIVMRRGQNVELRFRLPEGLAWPANLLPEAYPEEFRTDVWRSLHSQNSRRAYGANLPDYNMFNIRAGLPEKLALRLAPESQPFYVALCAPGFLQQFEAGPFSFADVKDGVLEIEIPRPAALDVSFDPGGDAGEKPFSRFAFELMATIPGQRQEYVLVAAEERDAQNPELHLSDLGPGVYRLSVRTIPKPGVKELPGTNINPGAYHDLRTITLGPGQSEQIQFRFTPVDPKAFSGNRTAVVRILTPEGVPAANRKATVSYYDGHFGPLSVFSGNVPKSGELVLNQLTDRRPGNLPRGHYEVKVDDKPLGSFDFTQDSPTQEFTFRLVPGIGDRAPDVDLQDIATGKNIKLSDLRGKVVYLEFWATWCGPCQAAMQELNELFGEQADTWRDRVRIISVSIDDNLDVAKMLTQQRNWDKLDHYWSGAEGSTGFESPALRAFVGNGVPEAVLIDAQGRILWRGHPLDIRDGQTPKTRIDAAIAK